MTSARDYNAARIASGELTIDHVTELVRSWQDRKGLVVDGKAGPMTLESIAKAAPRELAVVDGWLVGPGVTRIDAHASWFGGPIAGGRPRGIVAHFTATGPGTALAMARRRQHPYGSDPDDRLASWHVTVESDGSLVQMIALDRVAWHAGSSTARKVPGLGWANQTTTGVELVGFGRDFPPAQVSAAKSVWRALVQAYEIPREHAMIQHSEIDPIRRDDPGPTWMGQHADAVLAHAYLETT